MAIPGHLGSVTSPTARPPKRTGAPRVTRGNLGAWLLKTRPTPGGLPETVADGRPVFRERCVTRGYRAELMLPGDPVVLWLSGPSTGRGPTPGVWGIGELRSPAAVNAQGQYAVGLELPVADEVLVGRDELLTHPELAGLEVVRMPAGANPSWLSRPQWAALQRLLGA